LGGNCVLKLFDLISQVFVLAYDISPVGDALKKSSTGLAALRRRDASGVVAVNERFWTGSSARLSEKTMPTRLITVTAASHQTRRIVLFWVCPSSRSSTTGGAPPAYP